VIASRELAIDLPSSRWPLDAEERSRRLRLVLQILADLLRFAKVMKDQALAHSALHPGCIAVRIAPDGSNAGVVSINGFEHAAFCGAFAGNAARGPSDQRYAAPEQLLKCQLPPDPATDMWAIGLMALELLVGRHVLFPNPCTTLHRIALYDTPLPAVLATMQPESSVAVFHAQQARQAYSRHMTEVQLQSHRHQGEPRNDEGEMLPPPTGLMVLAYSATEPNYLLEGIPQDVLALLARILRFAPSDRITADQALAAPVMVAAAGSRCTVPGGSPMQIPEILCEPPPDLVADASFYESAGLQKRVLSWLRDNGCERHESKSFSADLVATEIELVLSE
jgi:serine/threonine protein kinase